MLKQTLDKLEENIQDSQTLAQDKKSELLSLVDNMRIELGDFASGHAAQADDIAQQAHTAVRQVLAETEPQQVALTSQGLARSIEEFELSHPKLYDVIKAFAIRITGFGV